LTIAPRAVILFSVMACLFTIQRGNPCVLWDGAVVVAMEKIR
jgi:hypothetical protein